MRKNVRVVFLAIKYILLVGGLVAGAVTAGIQADLWQFTERQAFLLAVAVGLAALVYVVSEANRDIRGPRLDQLRSDVKTTLYATLADVHEEFDVSIREVGVSAFRIVRRWPWVWEKRLERIERARFAQSPRPSDIVWTKNKGVIGMAWAQKRPVFAMTGRMWANYRNCSKEKWDGARDQIRMGLGHDEFMELSEKYGAVFAIDIRDSDGRVVGVLAVDTQDQVHLDTKQMKEIACIAARVIAEILQRKRRS